MVNIIPYEGGRECKNSQICIIYAGGVKRLLKLSVRYVDVFIIC